VKRSFSDLSSASHLIAACTPHQQLVIAIMLDIDISLDLVAFGFCQAVINILRTCPKTEWINIAISLQLTAVVEIAVKFKSIGVVYAPLSDVFGTVSSVTDTVCVNVFAHVTAVLPVLCTILDIRAHAQLEVLFSSYGCTYSLAHVNLCLTIQLSLFLNPAFIAVCASLFSSLHITLTAHVIPLVHNCLLSVSVHLNIVLHAVLTLVGGLLNSVLQLTASVAFPCLTDVIVVVSPTCPCNSYTDQLNELCPHCSTCKTYGVPHPSLTPARCIFDLISFC
jgi:hypothetical protein